MPLVPESRMTLPIADYLVQPEPAECLVAALPTGDGGWVTSIARHWPAGAAARCRLCHECTVAGDVCLVMVRGRVPHGEACLYSPDAPAPPPARGRPSRASSS
jgi:hypothetical protein